MMSPWFNAPPALWFAAERTESVAPLAVGAASLVAVLVALLVAFIRRSNPQFVLASADRFLAAKEYARATKLYARAVAILEPKPPAYAGLRRRAYVGFGTALSSTSRRPDAFEAFKKAKSMGAELSVSGEILIAEMYADSDNHSDEAFDAYLAYIKLGDASGARVEKVYAATQRICEVQETMNAANRKAASARNRRVIVCNPNLEWSHYYLGLALLLDGHTQEAAACFHRVVSLNPARLLATYWLGVCYLQQPEPDLAAAIQWMDKFLASPNENSRTAKRQGSAAFEIGKRLLDGDDLPRAIHYLAIANSRAGDNAEYNYYFGHALGLSGDNKRALDFLLQATKRAPKEKSYAYRLGVELEKAGLLEDAAGVLQSAVGLDDAFAEAHELLASISLRLNDNSAAEKHAHRYLQLRPDDAGMLATLIVARYRRAQYRSVLAAISDKPGIRLQPKRDAEAFFCIGRSYLHCGDYPRAIEFLEQLPEEERGVYYRACALAHVGRPGEAMSLFSAIAKGGGNLTVRARAQRAHLLAAEGQVEQAVCDYRAVLSQEPDNISALHGLAYVACTSGNLNESLSWLDRAAARESVPTSVRYARALISERLGKLDDAAADLEKLGTDPDLKNVAALRLGVVECRRGNFEAAWRWLAIVSCEEPPDTVLFYRGSALLMVGKISEAIDDWSKLQSRHPEDERLALNLHRARYLLGAQLASRGLLPDAIAAWNRYLQAYPSDEKTVKDLAALHFRMAKTDMAKENHDISAALQHVEQALKRDPDDLGYLFHAALCELGVGRLDQCEQRLRKLIAIDRMPRTLYHLALCLLRKGENTEAIEMLEELKTAPTSDYTARGMCLLANEEIRLGRYDEAAHRLSAAVAAGSSAEAI